MTVEKERHRAWSSPDRPDWGMCFLQFISSGCPEKRKSKCSFKVWFRGFRLGASMVPCSWEDLATFLCVIRGTRLHLLLLKMLHKCFQFLLDGGRREESKLQKDFLKVSQVSLLYASLIGRTWDSEEGWPFQLCF